MAVATVGYEFLREKLHLRAFQCKRPARIAKVAKVVSGEDYLDVPVSVAPSSEQPLAHILFALKHESINLQILAQSLPQVPASQIMEAFTQSPAGKYLRIAAYLWEQFTGHELLSVPPAVGPYVDLFDTAHYITGRRVFYGSQGLTIAIPIFAKSATLRVTTEKPCSSAVAAIIASRSDFGLGTCMLAHTGAVFSVKGSIRPENANRT